MASWNLWWWFGPWQRRRDAIWPITEQASQPLPAGDGADDGRTVLFARIQTPTGPLPFFTAQLTSTNGHSQVRCRQVAALSRFVAAHLDPGFPPVITCDLNAEPDADEIRLLGGHNTAPVVGIVLFDGVEELDAIGPWEVLSWTHRYSDDGSRSSPCRR